MAVTGAGTRRWLELDGLDNGRDLGGMPLRGGGHTRHGVLLRSASLRFLSAADVRHLVEVVRLRLVLDLRTPAEIERDGPTAVARAGVETVALTFIRPDRDVFPRADDGERDPLLEAYLGYLSDHPENVVEAVRRLGELDSGPALVHCAAGKDRTGVLVALVLDAVGVHRAAVVADYALSAERVEAVFRRFADALGRPVPPDLGPHLPRAPVMESLLERLDADNGGAAGWLREHGLAEPVLQRLRARLGG